MPVADFVASFGQDAALIQTLDDALGLQTAARIAVAVSGGSDSTACLHLAARLGAARGWDVQAVTVDHALRPGSALEAQGVARFCETLGVDHGILRWEHGAVPGNLQDRARRARYGLMAEWGQARSISHILLGHTADDNAETLLMGLARSAGLDGLTGMRSGWVQGELRFVRPLLGVTRQDLRDCLMRHGVGWVNDPSNENVQFTRIRARRAMQALAPLGLTVQGLGVVIDNLAYAQSGLRWAVAQLAETSAKTTAGEVVIDRAALLDTPDEIARRLLIAALRWVSGADHPPRAEAVFRVFLAIRAGKDATLAGCRIKVAGWRVRVLREPRAVVGLVAAPGALWDGRWQVEGPFDAGHVVRALGASGLRQCKDWKSFGHSRDSLLVSPAVWQGDALIAAPVAGFGAGFRAQILRPFNQFVLSH